MSSSLFACQDVSNSEMKSLLKLSHTSNGHGPGHSSRNVTSQWRPSWTRSVRCGACRQAKTLPYITAFSKKVVSALTMTTVILVLCGMLYMTGHLSTGLQFSWRGIDDREQRLPQVIIAGVRKCGTRALLEFLSLHPDISHAHDEIHFFDRDDRYSLGLEWYRKQMPLSRPDQITIEKTPGYFITRHAPALIHNMNSSIKLLMIVRDPVTRIISDYSQSYANHIKKNMTFTAFEDLVIDPDTGDINTSYKPVWISLYYLHLMHWLDVFNSSQIHLVDGDDLVQNPIEELRKTQSFLGLRNSLTSDNFYFNSTRGFYCMKKDKDSRCLNPSKGRSHPSIKPRVLHKLYRFFKPYNEKFYKLSGQYFDWSESTHRKKSA